MMLTVSPCRICGDPLDHPFVAREMMLGLRDEFQYATCRSCGAVQLCEVPADMKRYYPTNYYAFMAWSRNGLRMRMRSALNRVRLGSFGLVSEIAARLNPHPATTWIRRMKLRSNSRVLDVGCGTGELLLDLHEAGFQHLTGVDAYIDRTTEPAPGVQLIKGEMRDLTGRFDVVMLHHTLEHIMDQHGALADVARLMNDDGWCLVRVPTVSSDAWERYGRDWVQLDAPRHVVLHSVESLTRAAATAGLRLHAVEFDSTEFQFLGSELYRRDLPLTELPRAFSRHERRRYRRLAEQLNRSGRGDQAAFYFRKS